VAGPVSDLSPTLLLCMQRDWRKSGLVTAQILHLQSHIDDLNELLEAQRAAKVEVAHFQSRTRADLQSWCQFRWHVGGEVRYIQSKFDHLKPPYKVYVSEAGTTVFHCLACNTLIEFASGQEAATFCVSRSPYVTRLLSNQVTRTQLVGAWETFSSLDHNCGIRAACIHRAIQRLTDIKADKANHLERLIGTPVEDFSWNSSVTRLVEKVHTHKSEAGEPPSA
jgi:hypothetical protein